MVELKEEGNEFFRSGDYTLAYKSYSKALKCCPISFAVERSMLYNNRAATKVKQVCWKPDCMLFVVLVTQSYVIFLGK